MAMTALAVTTGWASGKLRSPPVAADTPVTHVPGFELPRSDFVSAQAAQVMDGEQALLARCPVKVDAKTAAAERDCLRENYYLPMAQRLARHYPVAIERKKLAGVDVDVVTPAGGVAQRQAQRVLINLHGGAFLYGDRYGGQVESIAVAAVGKIKVVAVDYRMAPEHRFPAATEDTVAVYRELLKTYRADAIGIYGCSVGAILAAQTIAYLDERKLPLPGAIGMFGGGAYAFSGDSFYIMYAMLGAPMPPSQASSAGVRKANDLYAGDIAADDPRFFPGHAPHIMARFPPSLLITSTRDIGMSPAVATHSQLVKLGVPAELHLWEGMSHCFMFNPELEQSREAYDVIARFFDRQLGAH